MANISTERIAITKPSITGLEIEYVNDAITNGWGSRCYDYIHRFEKEFAQYSGTKYALATSVPTPIFSFSKVKVLPVCFITPDKSPARSASPDFEMPSL